MLRFKQVREIPQYVIEFITQGAWYFQNLILTRSQIFQDIHTSEAIINDYKHIVIWHENYDANTSCKAEYSVPMRICLLLCIDYYARNHRIKGWYGRCFQLKKIKATAR